MYWGAGIFVAGLIIHLIAWKISVPQHQAKSLFKIFSGIQLVLIAAFFIDHLLFADVLLPIKDFPGLLHVSLLSTTLTLVYITAFSAIEEDSPTVMIVTQIYNSGQKGITKDELYEKLTDESLIKRRIRYLLDNNLVKLDDGRFTLSEAGRNFVMVFIRFRALMRVAKGG